MKIIDDAGREIAGGGVVRLEPGDALIFTAECHLNMDQAARIRQQIERVFPHVPVLIVDKGGELHVARAG